MQGVSSSMCQQPSMGECAARRGMLHILLRAVHRRSADRRTAAANVCTHHDVSPAAARHVLVAARDRAVWLQRHVLQRQQGQPREQLLRQ